MTYNLASDSLLGTRTLGARKVRCFFTQCRVCVFACHYVVVPCKQTTGEGTRTGAKGLIKRWNTLVYSLLTDTKPLCPQK